MTINNELYDQISAVRIVFQDTFENELDIIKELKIYLIESGFSHVEINQTLYNFYQHINIPILLETIEEITYNSDPNINNFMELLINSSNYNTTQNNEINYTNGDTAIDNQSDSDDDSDVDIINTPPNIENTIQPQFNTINSQNNIINILNTLITELNNNNIVIQINTEQSQQFQNIVVTIDDEDYDKLTPEILSYDHDSSCSICMSNMIKNEKIISLNCNHTFHYDCITPYLKQFNYKCPVCRAEVGKPKYNI